jgi:hypothetical protein
MNERARASRPDISAKTEERRAYGPPLLALFRDRGPAGQDGRSGTTLLIQPTTLSTRAVVSAEECGQLGPLLSTDTSRGDVDIVKYGAPES